MTFWYALQRRQKRQIRCREYETERFQIIQFFEGIAEPLSQWITGRRYGSGNLSLLQQNDTTAMTRLVAYEEMAEGHFARLFDRLIQRWAEFEQLEDSAMASRAPDTTLRFRQLARLIELNETTGILLTDLDVDWFVLPQILLAFYVAGIRLNLTTGPFSRDELDAYLDSLLRDRLELDGDQVSGAKAHVDKALVGLVQAIPGCAEASRDDIDAALDLGPHEGAALSLREAIGAGQVSIQSILEGFRSIRVSALLGRVRA